MNKTQKYIKDYLQSQYDKHSDKKGNLVIFEVESVEKFCKGVHKDWIVKDLSGCFFHTKPCIIIIGQNQSLTKKLCTLFHEIEHFKCFSTGCKCHKKEQQEFHAEMGMLRKASAFKDPEVIIQAVVNIISRLVCGEPKSEAEGTYFNASVKCLRSKLFSNICKKLLKNDFHKSKSKNAKLLRKGEYNKAMKFAANEDYLKLETPDFKNVSIKANDGKKTYNLKIKWTKSKDRYTYNENIASLYVDGKKFYQYHGIDACIADWVAVQYRSKLLLTKEPIYGLVFENPGWDSLAIAKEKDKIKDTNLLERHSELPTKRHTMSLINWTFGAEAIKKIAQSVGITFEGY